MPSSGRSPYLFDPAAAEATLRAFPALASELKPRQEGIAAEWFTGIRKSERRLYRVLGNTHYKHLMDLLEALDACLRHGYKQPRLLRTRARSSFAPDLAELRVAEHFARIVTSALTIAEVLWPKGRPLVLPREKAEVVQRFFQHEWIVVRDIDRVVAERARKLVWDHDVLRGKEIPRPTPSHG